MAMGIADWYQPKPVNYSGDKRIPDNGDVLFDEELTSRKLFHISQFSSIVYAEITKRRLESPKLRPLYDLRRMHDRSPSYFFSQFMPFCNNWFRNAFAKLDGRLQSKLGFAEFTKQVIMKTDWRLVWASGEISEDLNAIVALFNTALVAQWVIEEIIDADDDPAPRIDVWRWKEI